MGRLIDEIGSGAFYNSEALSDVYSFAVYPPYLSTDCFSGTSNDKILHILAGCSSAYKSSEWGSYFNTIIEMEE